MKIFIHSMSIVTIFWGMALLGMAPSKPMEIARIKLHLKKVDQELNQVGKKYIHHHGTEDEQKLSDQAKQLRQEKERLQGQLGDEIVTPGNVIAKIPVQEKVETLKNFLEIPVYPPVPAPLDDESDRASQESSPKMEVDSPDDNDDCQFTPDDSVSNKEMLEAQKKLFSSIANASPQQPKKNKPKKTKSKFESENIDNDLLFEFDEEIAARTVPKKKSPKPTSPVTALHVAKLYTKVRFPSSL